MASAFILEAGAGAIRDTTAGTARGIAVGAIQAMDTLITGLIPITVTRTTRITGHIRYTDIL